METGPQLKVSFDRLVKPGIEPATPGLQGKGFTHGPVTGTIRNHLINDIFIKKLLSYRI